MDGSLPHLGANGIRNLCRMQYSSVTSLSGLKDQRARLAVIDRHVAVYETQANPG